MHIYILLKNIKIILFEWLQGIKPMGLCVSLDDHLKNNFTKMKMSNTKIFISETHPSG